MHYTIDGSLILNNQKIIENFQTNNSSSSAPSNTSSTPANNTSSTPANNTSSTPANINYSTDNNIDIYKLSNEINNINNILQSTVKRDELSKLNQDLVNLYNMINNNPSETVKKEELTAFGNNILNIVDTNIKNITNQIQYQQKEIQNKFAKIQDTMEKLKLLFSDSSFSLKDQILSSSSIEIKK